MMSFIKNHWLLLVVVLVILSTRLLLFNKDALQFWADEGRYPILIDNLNEASRTGNYLLPIQKLFNLDARPGAGLFYYPAAFLEWINPNIPFASYYNLIINSLSLILVFLIIKKIKNLKVAALVTLFVTFSLSSPIYIRHTLPYDIALFLLLLGLFFYVYFQKSFVFGVFAGLSFITYPSYYYYILPIPFILTLYQKTIKSGSSFVIGALLVLVLTQVLSAAVHSDSYFRSLKDQSGGVTAIAQGDYLPAASYIGEYILATDGYFNLFLILSLLPAIFLIKNKKKIIFFFLYLIAVFLILEVFSHILQKHVLYGRTVRPLYLLTLGFSAIVFERVFRNFKSNKVYIICVGILLLGVILNWLPRFLEYKNLIYPIQFKKEVLNYLNSRLNKYEIEDALFVNYWDTENPDPKLVWHFFKPGKKGEYYTMNAIQTFPYYGNLNMDNFCKNEVLIKKPQIQYAYKPYRFEGYKKRMRDRMDADPFYYQLIHCL